VVLKQKQSQKQAAQRRSSAHDAKRPTRDDPKPGY
jgi:hypothetical protein